jgi:hypothetical protein
MLLFGDTCTHSTPNTATAVIGHLGFTTPKCAAAIRTAAERGKIGSAKGLHRATVRR